MDGQILESLIDDETEDQTQCGNNQTGGQQGGAVNATRLPDYLASIVRELCKLAKEWAQALESEKG